MAKTFGPYPGEILSVHDGDTCTIELELEKSVVLAPVDLGFGFFITPIVPEISFSGASCRVFGINAPELSTPAGKAALAFAQTLLVARTYDDKGNILTPGTKVSVISHWWDKFGGRYDGEIILPDGTSFGQRMLDSGHAVVYS